MMGYFAFLSYSRADDKQANWLHRRLDSFRTPKPLQGADGPLGPAPAKLHPIFRDRTDMAGGGSLSERIDAALAESQALIVLCSPAAAQSPWVDREVATFIARQSVAKVFPVIASGLPNSEDVERDFFPPALRGHGLLAADLREIRLPDGKVVGDGQEGGRLKLIAGLLGVSLDALVQRERQRQRVLMLSLGASAVVFAGLAATAGVLGVLAEQNRQQAARNARIAQERAAVLSIDAARAQLAGGDTNAALLVLLEATRTFSPDEHPTDLLIAFDEALRRAESETIWTLAPGTKLFDAPDGVLLTNPAGEIRYFDGEGEPRLLGKAGGPLHFASLDAKNGLLAIREDFTIERITEAGAEPVGAFEPQPLTSDEDEDLPDFEIAPDGSIVGQPYAIGRDYEWVMQVFDLNERRLYRLPAASPTALYWHGKRGERATYELQIEGGLDRLAQSCGVDPARPDFQKLALDFDFARAGRCQSIGPATLFTLYTYGSGGTFRHEVLLGAQEINIYGPDGDAPIDLPAEFAQRDSGSVYVQGGLEADYATAGHRWAGVHAKGLLGMATTRHVAVLQSTSSAAEWRLPGRIRYARFLQDGKVVVSSSEAEDRLIILDPSRTASYGVSTSEEEARPDQAECLMGSETPSVETRKAEDAELEFTLSERTFQVKRTTADGASVSQTLPLVGCAELSPSGRYLLGLAADGRTELHDLTLLGADPSASRLAALPLPTRASASFVDSGADLLIINGNTVSLATAQNGWKPELLFEGDRRPFRAQLSPNRKFLLVDEDLGGSTVGGLLYSIEAASVWRRLGSEYKWFWSRFVSDDTVEYGLASGPTQRLALHDFQHSIAAAEAALDTHCQGFPAGDYRASPCWPADLE